MEIAQWSEAHRSSLLGRQVSEVMTESDHINVNTNTGVNSKWKVSGTMPGISRVVRPHIVKG